MDLLFIAGLAVLVPLLIASWKVGTGLSEVAGVLLMLLGGPGLHLIMPPEPIREPVSLQTKSEVDAYRERLDKRLQERQARERPFGLIYKAGFLLALFGACRTVWKKRETLQSPPEQQGEGVCLNDPERTPT